MCQFRFKFLYSILLLKRLQMEGGTGNSLCQSALFTQWLYLLVSLKTYWAALVPQFRTPTQSWLPHHPPVSSHSTPRPLSAWDSTWNMNPRGYHMFLGLAGKISHSLIGRVRLLVTHEISKKKAFSWSDIYIYIHTYIHVYTHRYVCSKKKQKEKDYVKLGIHLHC